MKTLAIVVALSLSSLAAADSFEPLGERGIQSGHGPHYVVKVGTLAPDNSFWAREHKALINDVLAHTKGDFFLKWYFGGVAGGEDEMLDRIKKGQLDGVASGGMSCVRVAPSMRVMEIPGLFQSREEASEIMHLLRPTIDKEARQNGFIMAFTTGLGPRVIFSRTPVRNMDELRKTKMWLWNLDEVTIAYSRAMGLSVVPTRVEDAARTYDTGKMDGFFTFPTAALGFQWSAQASYITDLRGGFVTGCMIVASRAFDRLPIEYQEALRTALASTDRRFEETGGRQDNLLLGGLFQKQGLKAMPVSESFRAQFFAAAQKAREQMGDKLIPQPLIDRVLRMLSDYRAEHAIVGR